MDRNQTAQLIQGNNGPAPRPNHPIFGFRAIPVLRGSPFWPQDKPPYNFDRPGEQFVPVLRSQTVQLCADPNIDRLFAMVFALGAELTSVSEQLDTLKRVIVERNLLSPDELAAYRPTQEVQAERDEARRSFIATLMASFDQEIKPASEDDSHKLKG
jgi:hypothetical protein